MIDSDLARLYGVTTGRLNEQVKRNALRFLDDFAFQLAVDEFESWSRQPLFLNFLLAYFLGFGSRRQNQTSDSERAKLSP